MPEQSRDLLEIVDDRYDSGSTLITSQVPIDRWYEIIGIPTLADAMLDRLLRNAHRIELAGESVRKRKAAEQPLDRVNQPRELHPRPTGSRRH